MQGSSKKKAIVVVSFGSSYPETLKKILKVRKIKFVLLFPVMMCFVPLHHGW